MRSFSKIEFERDVTRTIKWLFYRISVFSQKKSKVSEIVSTFFTYILSFFHEILKFKFESDGDINRLLLKIVFRIKI